MQSEVDNLNPDARPRDARREVLPPEMLESAPPDLLRRLLVGERAAHENALQDLEVERAAHDETAEKMVQLQQRLEVTLQELANLERFTRRQQSVPSSGSTAGTATERLLKEEAYLKSRLRFVQQELNGARGAQAVEQDEAEERSLSI